MAKVSYVGDSAEVTVRGVRFVAGTPVEVSNRDILTMTENNPFFVVHAEGPPPPPAQWDGAQKQLEAMSVDKLREQAEADEIDLDGAGRKAEIIERMLAAYFPA